mmetsp:Transcript_37678/g.82744  ORF Transcript_37678/g.82744 Transcript_37678/m.82744 type:complete len:535 (-) Transcript_37678:23-1627(-)
MASGLEIPASESEAGSRLPPLVTGGTVCFERRGGGGPFFSMGEGTLKVPMAMHAENRARLCAMLREQSAIGDGALLLLQGGVEISVYDTDTQLGFRQESNFQYLFGVKEPDCYAALRVRDGHSILFVPEQAEAYQAWMGPCKPPAWYQLAYAVDEVHYVSELKSSLEQLGAAELLMLHLGTNRDSGLRLPQPSFDGIDSFKVSSSGSQALWDTLCECRLVKSTEELKVLQYVNDVSSRAHIEVMLAAKAGQREHFSEAVFRFQASLRGCLRTGYACICPSGRRNAILHYGHSAEPNSERVLPDDLTLHDMGAEYHCYTADVTCTFPVSGRFSEAQRTIYEAVWAATLAVEQKLQPGVNYKDMHRLAQRTLLEKLSEAGLFAGSVNEMMAAGLMSYFMPHGLGHTLGLDVHDVGGYPPGVVRSDDPSIKENLRLGRELKEGMVLTVEPGFYFVDYLVEQALSKPEIRGFINTDRLYVLWREVGGVRIEDDVVVTAKGCRLLTCVPRTCEEIEAVMAGQSWDVSQACCREYTASAL